jgi:hypothetical protein
VLLLHTGPPRAETAQAAARLAQRQQQYEHQQKNRRQPRISAWIGE